jgi:DHA1 family tetracycline resistance protein-like MFS transporter
LNTTTTTAPGRQAAMPFIMLTVLIDMVSIGLIIPVLAPLIGSFTTSQSEQALWYGAVTIAFGIANFFGSPILGRLSDRYGRRPVLLIGFSGLALSFFVTGAATALWMLLAVRLFSGAMQSNVAVANAYVADITPPADRAKAFGKLGAMLGLGFILGPVFGGLLGGISLHLPFFVAGGLSIINWLYGYFVLPESLPLERRQPFVLREANPVASLRGLTKLKGVGSLVVVIGLSGLAQFMTHTTWVLYTTFKFGWGPTQNGWSLFAIGLMSMLVQGVLLADC